MRNAIVCTAFAIAVLARPAAAQQAPGPESQTGDPCLKAGASSVNLPPISSECPAPRPAAPPPEVVSDQQRAVGAAIEKCNAQQRAGILKTHVEITTCDNEGMTHVFEAEGFPYMDVVYELEGRLLDAASRADHKEITEADLSTAFSEAILHMNAEIAQRNEARAAADQREQQQRDDAYAQAQAQDQQNAAEARRALMLQYFAGRFRPLPPLQAYQIPISPSVNCTTSYVGTQAYTNCR
jgi:hypothetical protein